MAEEGVPPAVGLTGGAVEMETARLALAVGEIEFQDVRTAGEPTLQVGEEQIVGIDAVLARCAEMARLLPSVPDDLEKCDEVVQIMRQEILPLATTLAEQLKSALQAAQDPTYDQSEHVTIRDGVKDDVAIKLGTYAAVDGRWGEVLRDPDSDGELKMRWIGQQNDRESGWIKVDTMGPVVQSRDDLIIPPNHYEAEQRVDKELLPLMAKLHQYVEPTSGLFVGCEPTIADLHCYVLLNFLASELPAGYMGQGECPFPTPFENMLTRGSDYLGFPRFIDLLQVLHGNPKITAWNESHNPELLAHRTTQKIADFKLEVAEKQMAHQKEQLRLQMEKQELEATMPEAVEASMESAAMVVAEATTPQSIVHKLAYVIPSDWGELAPGALHHIATNGKLSDWVNPAAAERVKVMWSSVDNGVHIPPLYGNFGPLYPDDATRERDVKVWSCQAQNLVSGPQLTGKTTDPQEPGGYEGPSGGPQKAPEGWVGMGISQTNESPGSWMAVDLGPSRKMVLTHYSLRGCGKPFCGPRNWSLEAANSIVGDNDEWKELKLHEDDARGGEHWGCTTWAVTAKSAFRCFRIKQNGPNQNGGQKLACGGIEFYGVMFEDGE